MAMSPRFTTSNLVWQVLSVLSLVYTTLFLVPYCLKLALYPRKVWKEWMHPGAQQGSFLGASSVQRCECKASRHLSLPKRAKGLRRVSLTPPLPLL